MHSFRVVCFTPGRLKLSCYLFLPTYLLTPCSTVLLEKLTGSQLVKKLPAICGTRRFITAATIALCFATWYVFTLRSCLYLAQPTSWRTTPFRLYAIASSIYSQLPSILWSISTFLVVQKTSGRFGLHGGNLKFNTQNEDWVDISIIYVWFYLCFRLYIYIYIYIHTHTHTHTHTGCPTS